MPVALIEDSEPPWFPHPETAWSEGLLAVGGSLTPERLLLAYSSGIFPWFSEGEPPLWHWFSPDPRFLLAPNNFTPTRSLKAALCQNLFEVKIDEDFPKVIRSCARAFRKDQPGTWIAPDMIEAYCRLHELGYAHSFESYQDGELVGGLYGISLGRAFFGESMFHKKAEASKVALATLVAFARERDFPFIDCQDSSRHLARLGAEDVPRSTFLRFLAQALEAGATLRGSWRKETELP